jgi:hypothetical protein
MLNAQSVHIRLRPQRAVDKCLARGVSVENLTLAAVIRGAGPAILSKPCDDAEWNVTGVRRPLCCGARLLR